MKNNKILLSILALAVITAFIFTSCLPKTQVAVVKSKAVMEKMADDTYNALKEIIRGFAGEVVRKALFN